jgi:hypothetical protein
MGAPDAAPWCSLEPKAAPSASTPTPTWYGEAEAIVARKCRGCHAAGGLAPFQLDSYDDVALRREAIRAAVEGRTMPPWYADRCCTSYFDDRSLEAHEHEALLRFLSEGLPKGDPASAQPLPEQLSLLSRVDVSVTMPAEYVPSPPAGTDDNRCFLLDWPLEGATFITGMAVRPGVRREVHHVVVAAVKPEAVPLIEELEAQDAQAGFDCNGGFGDLRDVVIIGGSVQGGDIPRGLGTAVTKGSKLVLNIHYSTLGVTNVLPDRTSIDFKVDDTARDAQGAPIANPAWLIADAMKVSAGDPDAVFFYKYKPKLLTGGKRVLLQGVTPHMHTFGSRIKVSVLKPGGESVCLLEIPRWRFGWEQPFWLAEEIPLEPDDELYLECHFDNSAANQPPGQAPRDFAWGGNGQDMCAAFVAFTKAEP